MNLLTETLADFRTTQLEEIKNLAFESRLERKYIFPVKDLPELLQDLKSTYRLLEVRKKTNRIYETTYYDTGGFSLYLAHHNGKPNRLKVRERLYIDTGNRFLEIKQRRGDGSSIKKRIALDPDQDISSPLASDFILTNSGYPQESLLPTLTARYLRLTLCNANERMTFDLDLALKRNEKSISFEQLVIAELKQGARITSPFLKTMQNRNIRERAFSKYCVGLASLVPDIKTNNFKELLHRLQKTEE